MTEVATALEQSRAAHRRYQNAHRLKSRDGARAALRDAKGYRTAAHLADPDHTDPAWRVDEQAGHSHAALMTFYEVQLSH